MRESNTHTHAHTNTRGYCTTIGMPKDLYGAENVDIANANVTLFDHNTADAEIMDVEFRGSLRVSYY